jgi:hypothetical protein
MICDVSTGRAARGFADGCGALVGKHHRKERGRVVDDRQIERRTSIGKFVGGATRPRSAHRLARPLAPRAAVEHGDGCCVPR